MSFLLVEVTKKWQLRQFSLEKQRSEIVDRLKSYLTKDTGDVVLKKDGDACYGIEQYPADV